LEADNELRESEGYEIPGSSILERWQNTIEEINHHIEILGDPL